MLSALVPKLRDRFGDSAAQCGASSSTVESCESVSIEMLKDVLNEARIEYSRNDPTEEILKFNVTNYNPVIVLPYEPFAVTAVYTYNSYGYRDVFIDENVPRHYLANYYADPAIARVDNMYQDYATPEATFVRTGKTIRITSSVSAASVAEITMSRMRLWSEMPEWSEPIVIKMGLIKLIDQLTTSSGGLLRIPTPTGYFEFDGGRVMQNLRTKLDTEINRDIKPRTHGILQG